MSDFAANRDKTTSYHILADIAKHYVILCFLFFMPLYKPVLTPLVICWCILWLLGGGWNNKLSNLKENKIYLLPLIFYFIHIIGMIYTENFNEGMFDLEVKLAILIFSILIFSNYRFFVSNFNKFLWAFLVGNMISAIICLFYGIYRNINSDVNYLNYTDYSLFFHTSYASMYALLSIAVVFYFMIKNISNKIMLFVFLVVLFIHVYFLGSRTGIMAAIALLAVVLFSYTIMRKKWVLFSALAILFVVTPIVVVNTHPRFIPLVRFINTPLDSIKSDAQENIMVRYVVARHSIELANESFLTGKGTGDIKQSLEKMYTDKNIVYALNPLINVHNQFIETYLGLGLFGLSCLIIMLFSLLYYGIRNKYLLPIMFAVIIFFNFNFESMLNTQAGVFFFAFFFCLSFIKPK